MSMAWLWDLLLCSLFASFDCHCLCPTFQPYSNLFPAEFHQYFYLARQNLQNSLAFGMVLAGWMTFSLTKLNLSLQYEVTTVDG